MPTAQFPTQITDQLYEVVSRLSTTLTADISVSDETIPVASTAGFPDKGFVVIDNETIYYSSLGVNSLICTGGRGFSGTAASHLKDTQVKAAIVAEHFNRFRVELIATQQKIGISGSTYTTTLDYKANQGYNKGTEALNYLYGTSSCPAFIITPSTAPSTDYQIANKKYVDDNSGVTPSNTVTLTNKRITLRINSITSTSSLTIDSDNYDMYCITALAEDITINAPSGTPTQGQKLIIRITDNGTSRTLTFNSIFRASTNLALPTATTASETLYLGFIYNSTDSKWDFVAMLDNF